MNTLFTGVVPIFAVEDVAKAKDFYTEYLDMTVDFIVGDPPEYAGLYKDDIELHLIRASLPHAKQPAGNGYLSILTDEVDDLHARLNAAGVRIVTPPEDRPYGLRDFDIRDPNGNAIFFSTPLPR